MAKEEELDNLSRCSNEALAAGMTYGKYMALKYEKERPPKMGASPPLPGWKVCPYCGAKFYAAHGKMKYCSAICGTNATYQKRRETIIKNREPIPPKICAVCGKEFIPFNKDSRIKYCSEQCRLSNRSEIQEETYWKKKAEKRGVKDGD